MAIDTNSPRTRRALLTAALGGAAAAVAATVARNSPVGATNGDPVLVGKSNFGTSPTSILNSSPSSIAIFGSGGTGVAGFSKTGSGVVGQTNKGVGVEAETLFGGHALRTKGRIKVEQVSGVATIKRGKKTVTVSPGVDINARTFVLLTAMSNVGSRGLWFTKLGAANKIVIHMSSKRTGPTKVAWLALERG